MAKAQVIKSKHKDLAPLAVIAPEATAREVRTENFREFKTLPEKIAESAIFTRNWKVPKAAELFPDSVDSRFVEYHFPYARGGELLMDVLRMPEDAKRFEAKGQILKRAKLRYLIVDPKKSFPDIMSDLEATR